MMSINNFGFPIVYTNIYSCLTHILGIAFFILKFKLMVGAINGFAVKSLFHHGGWIPWEGGILMIMWVAVTAKGIGMKRKRALLYFSLISVCSITATGVLFMRKGKRDKKCI